MVFTDLTPHRPLTERGFVQIPNASAFNICDGLFRMANCFITELPDAELRGLRHVLDTLLMKVDRLLDPSEPDFSLNFEGLALDSDVRRYPGSEDFGAVTASTSVTANTSSSTFGSPSRHRRNTVSRVPAPATPIPTPCQTPTPDPSSAQIFTPTHGRFPLILSSRGGVGFPDYTHHPLFIRPGIPGAYQHPPTVSGLSTVREYYVVSKGLYVGIFLDWNEVSHWVTGIPGSIHRKYKTWEEAKEVYNSRLASNTVQVVP